MEMLATVEQARERLRIDLGEDDEVIADMIAAATRIVEVETGRTTAEGPASFGDDEPIATQAVLLLVKLWFDDPVGAAAAAEAGKMPAPVGWLLWPIKRLAA